MTDDEVLDAFRASNALLEGHFILSSGKHSSAYLQCALVLADAQLAEKLCQALAKKVRDVISDKIDIVVSPAMGGVVVGYEMGRQLSVPAIFTERVDGKFEFRRGFELPKGANVLMVEDVVTTGLSSRECIDTINAAGGNVVGATCLVDRSNGTADVGVPLVSLIALEVPVFDPSDVPDALRNVPAVKPGSRSLT